MPALLFHQNMRTFGGAAQARLNAYCGIPPAPWLLPDSWPGVCPAHNAFGFPAIEQALRTAGAPPFGAIGLTEMTNGLTAFHATAALCQALTGGHGTIYCLQCGVTAGNRREYAMIAVATGVRVLALGRIVTGAQPEDRICDAAPPGDAPGRWSALPPGAPADWRFVVYAVLQFPGGSPFAVGFLHNTYTLDSKTSADLQLPYIVDCIWDNDVCTPQHVYIGGDFNVIPHGSGTRRPLHPHFAATEANTPRIFGGTVGGTTWSGELYDYWLSDQPWGTPGMQAGLSTATWDGPSGLMSDHVAITLRIP